MNAYKLLTAALKRSVAVFGVTFTLTTAYAQDARRPPLDYRDRHPIALKQGERTVEVFIGRNRGGLSPEQRADVVAFARAWRKEASGGILIDVPADGTLKKSSDDTLREIHSIFAQSGVPRHAVRVANYPKRDLELPSIKLNYPRLVATTAPCGVWPTDIGPAFGRAYNENDEMYNLGCASQRNLAAMIDNPADLIQPRGETPAYAARRSMALEKYRKGDDPAGVYNKYDTGKISDLGK